MQAAETKGFLRASNQMTGSVEAIGCGSGKNITFENISSKGTIRASFASKSEPLVNIDIHADLNITSMPCSELEINPKSIHEWEIRLNETIAEEVREFIRYSQKHKVDLLGIGERLHRNHPKQWRSLKESWEERYGSVRFEVTVHSRIDHSNFIM
jgi:hypothetical protein